MNRTARGPGRWSRWLATLVVAGLSVGLASCNPPTPRPAPDTGGCPKTIAVSATGDAMQAGVAERFGRAPYFVIVDSETMRFDAVANPSGSAARQAGPGAARLVADRRATVVLAGRVGSKARAALGESGIAIVEGVSGTVEAAVAAHLHSACGKTPTP